MDEGSSPYIQLIQDCEAAIVRIRAALRSGTAHAPEVGDDWERIRRAVTPRLTRYAMSVRRLAPDSADEALEAMFDRLLDDIWSLTYVSMETQFGAYLNSMPIRILQKIRRKYVRDDASLRIERLDDRVEEGQSLHDTVADPDAELPFAAIGEREALVDAIAQLPAVERHVIQLRLAGLENNAIAHTLAVSPATATRIYQRAIKELQRRLGATQE